MQSKSLLIAIAAFAVTATAAQAHVSTKYFNQAGLSNEQIEALSQARELRQQGEAEKARDVLLEAGVTEETLESLRDAAKKAKNAIKEAVEEGDYEAFRQATVDTPLYDIVNTEADFELFKQAHDLRAEGKHEEAKEIMTDLGFEPKDHKHGKKRHFRHREIFEELTEEQQDALRVARQANDHETVRAILTEAGIEFGKRKDDD